jgi:predicted glycosyltransferase
MERQQALAGYRLLVFAPLFLPEQRLAQLGELASGSRIEIRPFSRDFVDWMYGAELAISEAGYNTCMNILETGTRAILIPNPLMSDQSLRARRFAESLLATVIEAGDLTPERLGRAMVDSLARPARPHNIDLDGARKTLAFLDSH